MQDGLHSMSYNSLQLSFHMCLTGWEVGGGGGEDVQSQILKANRLLIICLILVSFISTPEHRFVKLLFIDHYTVTERP